MGTFNKVHFIGIGGIGSSALAKYYLKNDCKVSGSDLSFSEITKALKKSGAKIFLGHRVKNIPENTDLVLITPAVDKNNVELKEAKKRKIKIQTWEENLGELTKKYFTIAVSGAHGKSTTTALISVILMKAGLDPTVIIGTKLKEFGDSNCRVGKSLEGKQASYGARKYLVIEADEYKSSFLNYWPKIIVLTNLEYEHPDYFKSFQNYLKIFKEYIGHLGEEGILVMNNDDRNIKRILNSKFKIQNPKKIPNSKFQILNYSIKQKETKELKKILQIPGEHNISNALAALTVARLLKIPDKINLKALSEYRGAWRRFEIYHKTWNMKRITIVSDYAHHPTQVRTTIAGAKEKYPKSKIWAVYQPHQYLRTYYLFKDYVKAFDGADEIVLPEIYAVAGREKKEIMEKLSSANLKTAIEKRFKKIGKKAKVHFLKNYTEVPSFLKNKIGNNDVILIMGAGDIYKLIPKFRQKKLAF